LTQSLHKLIPVVKQYWQIVTTGVDNQLDFTQITEKQTSPVESCIHVRVNIQDI